MEFSTNTAPPRLSNKPMYSLGGFRTENFCDISSFVIFFMGISYLLADLRAFSISPVLRPISKPP